MMSSAPSTTWPPAAQLARAAEIAALAPSIHNTQPWRWQVSSQALDLYADRARTLPETDPDGRMLTVSCAAALHHARVALAAEGVETRLELLPDPADTDHLARLSATGRQPVTAQAMRLLQAAEIRRTDRRPTIAVAVSAEQVEQLRQAAVAERVHLHRLTADQVTELVVAVSRAEDITAAEPAVRAETARWVGDARPEGAGLPAEVIPAHRPQTDVGERDFGAPGTLPIGEEHDRQSAYLVLFGEADERIDWLRAGQALSAVWLRATELGLAVLPYSQVIEVQATRVRLFGMLSGLGYPYLVLRVGVADPQHQGPPHTPRLPFEQTVDVNVDVDPANPDRG
jgi:nitroreductase